MWFSISCVPRCCCWGLQGLSTVVCQFVLLLCDRKEGNGWAPGPGRIHLVLSECRKYRGAGKEAGGWKRGWPSPYQEDLGEALYDKERAPLLPPSLMKEMVFIRQNCFIYDGCECIGLTQGKPGVKHLFQEGIPRKGSSLTKHSGSILTAH